MSICKLLDEGFVCFTFKSLKTKMSKNGKEKKDPVMGCDWHNITKENYKMFNKYENWALITGKMSDLTVIDIDNQDTYEKLIEKCPVLKECRTIKTYKGYHIYCSYNEKLNTSSNVCDHYVGIDIRNDGGIVFCPPTKYQLLDGTTTGYTDLGGKILPVPDIIMNNLNQNGYKKIKGHHADTLTQPLSMIQSPSTYQSPKSAVILDTYVEEEVKQLLTCIDPTPYQMWVNVGMCLKNIGTKCEMWDQWSQTASNYDGTTILTKWAGFNQPDGFKIGSLNQWAMEGNEKLYNSIKFPRPNHCVLDDDDDDDDEKKDTYIHTERMKDFVIITQEITYSREGKETIEEVRTPNFEACFKYFDQFLSVDRKNALTIEINTNSRQGYIIHKNGTVFKNLKWNCAGKYPSPYDSWFNNPARRDVYEIVYEPFLKNPIEVLPNQFNVFRGFIHGNYDESFVEDENLIAPIIDMLKHNWCNDCPKNFEYLIHWFGHKVQFPNKKNNSSIVITSLLEGIGKDTFFKFFNNLVIGPEFGIMVGSLEQLLCKFNDHFEKALIICCNELKPANGTKTFDYSAQLRNIITQEKRLIEPKGLPARPVNDYSDYIFFTNHWSVIKPSMSDRRYFCLEANNDRANDATYWNNLFKSLNPLVGKHFFYYLAHLDLSKVELKNIPMTEWKRQLKEYSIDPIVKCIIKYIKCHDEKEKEIFITIGVLYGYYESVTKNSRLNHRSFSVNFTKIYSLVSIKKNVGRGFDTTIDYLKAKTREIMKDPEYSFNDDEDEKVEQKDDDEEVVEKVVEKKCACV